MLQSKGLVHKGLSAARRAPERSVFGLSGALRSPSQAETAPEANQATPDSFPVAFSNSPLLPASTFPSTNFINRPAQPTSHRITSILYTLEDKAAKPLSILLPSFTIITT
jgi:hypothetical protein